MALTMYPQKNLSVCLKFGRQSLQEDIQDFTFDSEQGSEIRQIKLNAWDQNSLFTLNFILLRSTFGNRLRRWVARTSSLIIMRKRENFQLVGSFSLKQSLLAMCSTWFMLCWKNWEEKSREHKIFHYIRRYEVNVSSLN